MRHGVSCNFMPHMALWRWGANEQCSKALFNWFVERIFESSFVGRRSIIKERFSKKYRHPTLDAKLTLKCLIYEITQDYKMVFHRLKTVVVIGYLFSGDDGALFAWFRDCCSSIIFKLQPLDGALRVKAVRCKHETKRGEMVEFSPEIALRRCLKV